ncbi:MAG: hypothetical protein ACLQGP_41640 [Isosphaeraceae bacterium]
MTQFSRRRRTSPIRIVEALEGRICLNSPAAPSSPVAIDPQQWQAFIKNAVADMEGAKNPYSASFPKSGTSGLSFGYMQNDVANNSTAASAFRGIMNAEVGTGGLTQQEANRIVNQAIANRPLSHSEVDKVNEALANHKDLVDAADSGALKTAMGILDSAFQAAITNPHGPGELNPVAPNPQLATALVEWGNMTGGLGKTNGFLSGAPDPKHPKQPPPYVSQSAFRQYLSKQKQFRDNKAFAKNWDGRVTAATNSALQQAGATVTNYSPPQGQAISIGPANVNGGGSNYLAAFKNASGNQVGIQWSFATPGATKGPGSIGVFLNNQNLGTFQKGNWSGISLQPSQANLSVGNSHVYMLQGGVQVNVDGNGNVIDDQSDPLSLGPGDSGDTVSGNNITVDASNGDVFAIEGNGNTIDGSSDRIALGPGSTADAVSGNGDLVHADGGDSFTVNGTGDAVDGTSISVGFGSGSSNDTLFGASDTVSAADGASLNVTGKIISVNGSSDTVALGAGDSEVTATGNDDSISAVKGDSFAVNGNGDAIKASSDSVSLGSGDTGDTVTGNSDNINADSYVAVAVDGSHDEIAGGSGDSLDVTGTYDPVTTNDSTVQYNGTNTGDTVTGSGDTGADWGSGGSGGSGSGATGGSGSGGSGGFSGGSSGFSGWSGGFNGDSGGFSGVSGGYGGSGGSGGFSSFARSYNSATTSGLRRNGSGTYVAASALTLQPSMIGFENPTGAAMSATPVTIAHTSLATDNSGLNEGGSGNAVLTSPSGSRNDRTTVAMSRDGKEFDGLVDAGRDVEPRPLAVKLRSSNAPATSPLTGRTGFLPAGNGLGRRMRPVRDTDSPRPDLPAGPEIGNRTVVKLYNNAPDATDHVRRADPGRGIGPAGEAVMPADAVNREGRIGPGGRDVSHHGQPAALRRDSRATATTPGPTTSRGLEPDALDVLLESPGSWYRHPNPSDPVSTVMLSPLWNR